MLIHNITELTLLTHKEKILRANGFLEFLAFSKLLKKGKVFYDQEPPTGESTTTECGFNYQLLAVILLKWHNGELLVAVNHNQLQAMASETVDPIDWSYPHPRQGSTS